MGKYAGLILNAPQMTKEEALREEKEIDALIAKIYASGASSAEGVTFNSSTGKYESIKDYE